MCRRPHETTSPPDRTAPPRDQQPQQQQQQQQQQQEQQQEQRSQAHKHQRLPHPQRQQRHQILAITNLAFDDDHDSKTSPKSPSQSARFYPQPHSHQRQHHRQRQQPERQIFAVADLKPDYDDDDEISDLENQKNDILLCPTADAAKFQRYDYHRL